MTDFENPPALGATSPPEDSNSKDEAELIEPESDSLTDLVSQPAKVMRIGSMIKQLLDEVRSAPLDDASRSRMQEIYAKSISELQEGLSGELREELSRLILPFDAATVPSDAELRVAQAQLVGWLEGLFHGIQTAIMAQQMAAQAQMQHLQRSLPPGARPEQQQGKGPGHGQLPGTGQYL